MRQRNTVLATLLSIVLVFALVLPAAAAWDPSPTILLLGNHALLPDSSLTSAMPQIALAEISGQTREVNCTISPGVIVKAYLDGVEKASTVSDAGGNYTLVLFEPGTYEVVAGKWGLRDRNRSVHVEPGQEHTLEFSADRGLIPNAPNMSYVLACINLWQFGTSTCKLTMSTVLAVINAWQFALADEIVYYEHTKILTEEEADSIAELTEDGDKILFRELTGFVSDIQEGDILVSEHPVPGAEYGFLKRVIRVTNAVDMLNEGGEGVVEVEVEPATLEDVIERGVVLVTQSIPWEDIHDGVMWAEGVQYVQSAEDPGWFEFTPAEGITIEGYLRATVDAQVRIEACYWNGLQEFEFLFSPGFEMEATVTVEKSYNWESGDQELATLPIPPIPIWGPVSAIPTVKLIAGAGMSIDAYLEATVTYDRGYDIGVAYYNGEWESIGSVRGEGGSMIGPYFAGSAEARVYAGLDLSLAGGVPGVATAGLGTKLLGNIRTSGEIETSPWCWQYDVELYMSAEVYANLHTLRLANRHWPVQNWQFGHYPLFYGASGRVTDEDGDGLEGVTISFSGGHSSVTTNAAGYWCKHLLSGQVTVIPERSGYVFDAPSAIMTGSRSDLDFEAFEGCVSFPDPNLEAAVRRAIDIPEGCIRPSDLAGLTGLHAGNRGITDLTGLEHCSNLASLGLWRNQLSDISSLGNLTNLTFLDLEFNPISDISPVANLTKLEELWLGDNEISDISPLADLTSLELLWLMGNQISDVSPLGGLTKLTRLCLDENQISDISPLADLTSLDTLFLGLNQISDISPLVHLASNLGYLYLYSNQISDISPLASLTKLTDLCLADNQINDISPLAHLINLERGLSLDSNQISDITPLAGLTNLTRLDLGSNPISDFSPLSNLTNLTSLDLAHNNISDISFLPKFTDSPWVILSHNQISDVSPLAKLTNLTHLYLILRNNQITDISPLGELTNLEYLYLFLDNNLVSDLSPLVDDSCLWRGQLYVRNNPLSDESINVHIPELEGRGVSVHY